jgi:uncharacterized RmlC-like cupin family protein
MLVMGKNGKERTWWDKALEKQGTYWSVDQIYVPIS